MEEILQREKKVEFEQTKTNKKKKETFKSIPKHQSVQPISDNRPCIKTPACKKINKQKKISRPNPTWNSSVYNFLVPVHSLNISKGNPAAVVCTVVNQEAIQTPRP